MSSSEDKEGGSSAAGNDGATVTAAENNNNSNRKLRPKIQVLPRHVVDQIAAGEVVQRPVSVIKELLENSLDAGANNIVVRFDGLSHLSITDNGKGIPRKDLELLCTRHATSKLSSVDDFSSLETFGFRGEALASTSMVSRQLTVSSRVRMGDYDDDNDDDETSNTANNGVAYSQSYKNGKPIQPTPKPCARKVGTTITIQDLFYNVPHRLQAYSKKESEEYAKIAKVVQDYSVHYPSVGFVCQRKTKKQFMVDCNTLQIPAVKTLMAAKDKHTQEQTKEATKQILSHILESNLAKHLMYMECGTNDNNNENNDDKYKFRYACQLYFTPPSYTSENRRNKQGKFILFLNHRLVDLPPLKRALEEVYNDLVGSNIPSKPVLVISLKVPGCQVDVNVHPSKKQVALMHQEDLIGDVTSKLKERLEQDGQAFVAQSVNVKPKTTTTTIRNNPYKRKREEMETKNDKDNENDNNNNDEDDDENDSKETPSKKPQHRQTQIHQTPDTKPSTISQSTGTTSSTKKVAPKNLIRTNSAARAGAIEPFLVSTQTQLSQTQTQTQLSQNSESSERATNATQASLASSAILHVATCPLSKTTPQLDMTQPGAFADQLRLLRCTCPTEAARRTVLIPKPKTRPHKVVPTPSKYTSIATLRKRIGKQQCFDTTTQIRSAFFMGTLSHQRSLIQCDEHLVQINHYELAKELFYQLSLARFGGAKMAMLGSPIHIQTVVSQALQCEDELALLREKNGESNNNNTTYSKLSEAGMLEVNESNRNLAQHVTARLVESAAMLDEYFSIRIESPNSSSDSIDDISGGAILTGLPVLLEGHVPQPHALPIFLLRLATQVDWTREKHCFHGVCKELGNYYAMLPKDGDNDNTSYVQHHLFPALSYLMLPSKNLAKNGHFAKLTKLSTLYKVFERC